MRLRMIFAVSVFTLFLALSDPGVFAGMHGGMKSGDHSKMPGDSSGGGHMTGKTHGEGIMEHGSMGEHLFDGEVFGTKVSGSMVDIKAKMAKMGKGMGVPSGITHHFMLIPEKPLGEGTAAELVVTYPGGKQKEVDLMAMGDHIGADLNLDKKGLYKLHCVVTRGPDSAAFDFEYEVK